ncbi:MAG: sodium:proton antiporter [Clostridia bacterium]|nr:sodium:proton antiporter [Clostridia bacterium]
MIERAYFYLYVAVCICLGIAVMIAIIRSVIAKTITGRFIGINMVTTIVLMVIFVLTLLLKEDYLPDVALVYALISCVSLIVLSKIYVNLFKKDEKGEDK